MKIITKCLLWSAGLGLTGCSLFTAPMEKPVLIDTYRQDDGKTLALAATADRREIIFYKDGNVCMESPPDISENISASLSNQFSVSAKTPTNFTAQAQDDIAHQIASAVAYAAKPSQGLMFYRTAMAWLCNENENKEKNLPDHTYFSAANEMLKISAVITFAELLVTNGKIGPESILQTPSNSQPSKDGAGSPTPAGDVTAPGAAQTARAAQTQPANPGAQNQKDAVQVVADVRVGPARQAQANANAPVAGNTGNGGNPVGAAQAQQHQSPNPSSAASDSLTGDQKVAMFTAFVTFISTLHGTNDSVQHPAAQPDQGARANTGTPEQSRNGSLASQTAGIRAADSNATQSK